MGNVKTIQDIKAFKGVIFDLDGTLIDSVADICKFANQILSKYGYPTHSLDNYIDWIGNGARKLIERAVPADMDSEEFEKLFAEYLLIYELDEHTDSVLYEGIPELLDTLNERNIPMAICTNKPYKVMGQTVKSYFSAWDFVTTMGQQDGKPKKPDPAGALQIAAMMNLAPEDILFIGDSAVDVKTGNDAGMLTICTTAGYETLENIMAAEPDVVIEEHKELLELFNE